MRSPNLLLLGALLGVAAVSGSVHKSTPQDVEIEIMPATDSEGPSSAEVMARLQQLMTTEDGREKLRQYKFAGALPEELGVVTVMAPELRRPVDLTAAITLSEDELTTKVKRLQAYKHLIELGAVNDPDVVRSALMVSGGNVPRAAIELRKAVERATGFRRPAPEDEEVEVEIEILPAAEGTAGPSASDLVAKLEKLLDTEDGWARIADSLTANPSTEWRLLTVCAVMALAIVALDSGKALRAFRAPDAQGATKLPPQLTRGTSLVENLERLTALKASGELSQHEFASAKRLLLAEKAGDGGSSPSISTGPTARAATPPVMAAVRRKQMLGRTMSCPDCWGDDSTSTDSVSHSRAAGSLHSSPHRDFNLDETVSVLTQQQRWCSL